MKKIAVVCELAGTNREGGEQKAMLRTAYSLRKKGYKVDVFTYTNTNPEFKIKTVIPLKLLLLPFIRDILFIPFIGRQLFLKIENTYDVIIVSSTTMASIYKPKTKLIITTHNIRSKKVKVMKKIPKYKVLFNPLIEFILRTFEKKSLNNSDVIITITEEQLRFLKHNLKVNRPKIVIIPNGIDINYFKPLNISKKNQVIFVGRGTVPKGIDTLLLASDKIKAKLLIVTKKIDDKYLDLALGKHNVEIRYDASPRDLVKLYSESKVFVLPSLDEEQPLTTMEAMSCGLPVVVTKKASVSTDDKKLATYLIKERDSENLIKITNLLVNYSEKKIKKLGMKNRKYILNNFDLKRISTMTSNLL